MPPFLVTVSQRRLAALALVAVVVGLLLLRHHGSGAGAAPLQVAPLVPHAAAPATQRALVVDVVGAVRRPGVYRLRTGARVVDAVARAGGLTRHAQRSAVNFAAPVADGQQVVVAVAGSPGAAPSAAGASPTSPVSLSAATAEQLDTLPGIGPVTAQKIVDYRAQHGPFTSVDGLDAIPGIGPARLSELQGLVVP